ncbi:hypothetical protein H5410_050420 [Solanum commersonii]|uniref:Uncharacterized protein n=1 Tax=Solanum commersonii TaxID=4109 RepID=A0A9J5WVF6_SOLCO|nr:hypothetical protein H5410_050420 [Solanum commersonii]
MSNPSSPSRNPLSPEMVKSNPFQLSTLSMEPSPFTPICGMGETSESTMPQIEVVDQSLVNLSVVKPTSVVPTEELDATSKPCPISSMMSGLCRVWLLERELFSHLSLRVNVSHQIREYVKDDKDISLSWMRKGVRGAHTLKKPLLTLKGLVLILKLKVLKDLVNLSAKRRENGKGSWWSLPPKMVIRSISQGKSHKS